VSSIKYIKLYVTDFESLHYEELIQQNFEHGTDNHPITVYYATK